MDATAQPLASLAARTGEFLTSIIDFDRLSLNNLDRVRRTWTAGDKLMCERLTPPAIVTKVADAVLGCKDIALTEGARRDVEAARGDGQRLRELMASPLVGGPIAAAAARYNAERAERLAGLRGRD